MTTSPPPTRTDASELHLELVARLRVDLSPTVDIGDAADGFRRLVPIIGGAVEGPLIFGEVLPGGADWNVWNMDASAGALDARYAIRTTDGVIIGVRNTGRHTIPTEDAPIMTTPSLEAPRGKYEWLNHVAFVGTLRPGAAGDSVDLEFWGARGRAPFAPEGGNA